MARVAQGARVSAIAMSAMMVLVAGVPLVAIFAQAAAARPAPVVPADAAPAPLTLETIMADPDWIGPPVRDAYWSGDGHRVYYSVKRARSPIVDLHRVEVVGHPDGVVDAREMAEADGPPVYDRARRRTAFGRNGDIFLRDLASGRVTQVTRSPQPKSDPRFSADGRLLTFRADLDWFAYDLETGVTTPAAILKLEKDPEETPKPDDLRDTQLRLFTTLKKRHDDAELLRHHARDAQKDDATRSALPFYMGEDVRILDTSLSPDAHWLVVVTELKSAAKGVEGKLTRYVTESGYEEFDTERLRVGRTPPPPQSVMLLNLTEHSVHPLAVDPLPGIHDDPLHAVRLENGIAEPAAGDAERKPRGVLVKPDDPDGSAGGLSWSSDGRSLAVQLRAIDNKDRWLATVDFARYALVPQHRLTDPAWIGWNFHEFGWFEDNKTLWYESEESGFAHLYTKAAGSAARPLTSGRFEISKPVLSPDGRWFYVLGNVEAPTNYDVYRVPSGGGVLQRVTRLQGVQEFSLDRTGARVLVTHSSSYVPAQIAVAKSDGSGLARDLTDTRTAQYRALQWIEPEFIEVPSTQITGVIHAKLYRAAGAHNGAAQAAHPAVVFVHGAGYTQNVHHRFPYYFREQMFHSMLARLGYVVIDLDYRASAGYGRDWRTAIYRQMGHPELDDLLDGKRWLVEHAAVDAKRVGIYGGSYGGFMTLMALFRAPGQFAAGAALRPVTDWMQYDRNYTANILNDPQVDPLAYARSSPIEFAAGLTDPLLICHGVIDDNVLFEDSMRLYQRLIELHKDNFTLSPYPLDSHGFVNADSWLDEYKRVYQLFDGALRPR